MGLAEALACLLLVLLLPRSSAGGGGSGSVGLYLVAEDTRWHLRAGFLRSLAELNSRFPADASRCTAYVMVHDAVE